MPIQKGLFTAIISGRNPMPAFKGTGKRPLVRIAKQKGNLSNAQTAVRQIAEGYFRAHLLQDI
jgi:hypothetical protein